MHHDATDADGVGRVRGGAGRKGVIGNDALRFADYIVRKEAASFPRRLCLHAPQQPLVRLRRRIQARKKFSICLRANRKNDAVQQSVLGRAPGGVENEIRTVLSGEFRRAINQLANLRSDAKIEGLALSGFAVGGTHVVS